MSSAILHLTSNDWVRGAIVTVLGAVFAYLAQILNAPGFDYTSIQWGEVLKIAVLAGMAYMGKNLGTDENGKFMGKI